MSESKKVNPIDTAVKTLPDELQDGLTRFSLFSNKEISWVGMQRESCTLMECITL